MMDSLYIVIPAYNEEGNIEDVIRQWYPFIDARVSGNSVDSRLVVADSGSTDRTHSIISKLQSDFPQLDVLFTKKQYHGPKVIALYKYAIANNADYIFQTDSDGQTNPLEFPSFWQDRNKYVGIFGNRSVRGDGRERAAVQKVCCFLLRLFFGVKIPDSNAPFRLMNAKTLSKYIDFLPEDYNIPNVVMTALFARYEKEICFREITFRNRVAGINSLSLRKIILIGVSAISDFIKFRKVL